MSFEAIASAAAERLLFCLGAGTLLAIVVWLLLRVFPRKDSRTSFAVWFATLAIMAVLPAPGLWFRHEGQGSSGAVVTVSAAWASYIFIVWAVIAMAGLVRVAGAPIAIRGGGPGVDVAESRVARGD
jgi:hypothetical protein